MKTVTFNYYCRMTGKTGDKVSVDGNFTVSNVSVENAESFAMGALTVLLLMDAKVASVTFTYDDGSKSTFTIRDDFVKGLREALAAREKENG